jgi:hypothetical protein
MTKLPQTFDFVAKVNVDRFEQLPRRHPGHIANLLSEIKP